MGRVNCTENVWLSKVPRSKGLGNPLGSEKVCFEKKIDPVSRLREHLLGNCRAPHARRHGRAVRPCVTVRPSDTDAGRQPACSGQTAAP